MCVRVCNSWASAHTLAITTIHGIYTTLKLNVINPMNALFTTVKCFSDQYLNLGSSGLGQTFLPMGHMGHS